MKVPKIVRRHCPYCKKHTEHKMFVSKKRAPSSMTHGSKWRARRRGKARGYGNLGRFSRKAINKWKRGGKKSSKKTDFRYECKECKKIHMQKKGFRVRRLEFK